MLCWIPLITAVAQLRPGQLTHAIIDIESTPEHYIFNSSSLPDCYDNWGNPIAVAKHANLSPPFMIKTSITIVGNPPLIQNGTPVDGFVKMYDHRGQNFLQGKLLKNATFIDKDTQLIHNESTNNCKGHIGRLVAISDGGDKIAFTCRGYEPFEILYIGELSNSNTTFTFVKFKIDFVDDIAFSGDGSTLFTAVSTYAGNNATFNSEIRAIHKIDSCAHENCQGNWGYNNKDVHIIGTFKDMMFLTLSASYNGERLAILTHKNRCSNRIEQYNQFVRVYQENSSGNGWFGTLNTSTQNVLFQKNQTITRGGYGHHVALSNDGNFIVFTNNDGYRIKLIRCPVTQSSNCIHVDTDHLGGLRYGIDISDEGDLVLLAPDRTTKISAFKFGNNSDYNATHLFIVPNAGLLDMIEEAFFSLSASVRCTDSLCLSIALVAIQSLYLTSNRDYFEDISVQSVIEAQLTSKPGDKIIVNCLDHPQLKNNSHEKLGALPAYLEPSMTNVTIINFADCMFEENTMPQWIFDCTHLNALGISNFNTETGLSGAIPTELGSLTNLQMLGLAYQQLSSAIPTQLLDLPQLSFIDLNGNYLTGTMPDFNVTECYFGGNCLKVPLTNQYCSLNDPKNNQRSSDQCPSQPQPLPMPSSATQTNISVPACGFAVIIAVVVLCI